MSNRTEACLAEELVLERLQKHHTVDYLWDNIKHLKFQTPVIPAGVLVPLLYKNGDLHFLLTKRSGRMKNYTGDICFPGGKLDDNDKDQIEASLREAEEEIGLPKDQVKVIAQLPTNIASGPNSTVFLITASVGLINEDFIPHINSEEVEYTMTIPVQSFLQGTGFTYRKWKAPNMVHKTEIYFPKCQVYNTEREEMCLVYGMTAWICITIAVTLYKQDFKFGSDYTIEADNPFKQNFELFEDFKLSNANL